MKIILDSNRVAVFFGSQGVLSLEPDGCRVGECVNLTLNSSNAQLVDVNPPELLLSGCYRLDGDEWVEVAAETIAHQKELVRQKKEAEVSLLRKAAYQDEADPLFFKYQRGVVSKEKWLSKVSEIQARYPSSDSPSVAIPSLPVTEL